MKNSKKSQISIGMPVFNCGKTIEQAINSLLNQTHRDFELIISDNNSTDETSEICSSYVLKDTRVRYYKHPRSISWAENFNYVLKNSHSEFFIWAAGDDFKSDNFLDLNLSLLKNNPSAVASMSTIYFENNGVLSPRVDVGPFIGEFTHKLKKFFKIAHNSHGMLYSLIRRSSIVECEFLPKIFFGWDWATILFLLTKGDIVMETQAYTKFGMSGVSNSPEVYKIHGLTGLKRMLPYLDFQAAVLKFLKISNKAERFILIIYLVRLHFITAIKELRKIRYFLGDIKKSLVSNFKTEHR